MWTVTVEGLEPHTDYHVVVQAYNTEGAGPLSPPAAVTTREDGEWLVGGCHTFNNANTVGRARPRLHLHRLSLLCSVPQPREDPRRTSTATAYRGTKCRSTGTLPTPACTTARCEVTGEHGGGRRRGRGAWDGGWGLGAQGGGR